MQVYTSAVTGERIERKQIEGVFVIVNSLLFPVKIKNYAQSIALKKQHFCLYGKLYMQQ